MEKSAKSLPKISQNHLILTVILWVRLMKKKSLENTGQLPKLFIKYSNTARTQKKNLSKILLLYRLSSINSILQCPNAVVPKHFRSLTPSCHLRFLIDPGHRRGWGRWGELDIRPPVVSNYLKAGVKEIGSWPCKSVRLLW